MEYSDQSDSRGLSARIRSGDRAAFERFFKNNYGSAVSYSIRLGANPAAADDLSQEAFLRIWTNRERIDPERSLEAFVFVTVRNLTLNSVRNRANRRRLVERHEQPRYVEDDPAARIDVTELRRRINEWIGRLPDREREAFTLSRFSNLSHREIADVMGISQQTVGKHITNALRTLRDHLGALHPELVRS